MQYKFHCVKSSRLKFENMKNRTKHQHPHVLNLQTYLAAELLENGTLNHLFVENLTTHTRDSRFNPYYNITASHPDHRNVASSLMTVLSKDADCLNRTTMLRH